MVKLNLGCGVHLKSGWINVDYAFTEEEVRSKKGYFQEATIEPDAEFVQAKIEKLPFPDDYADEVEMISVIEHIPIAEVVPNLQEVYRVMKPGAKLKILTPSFNGAVLQWLEVALMDFDLQLYREAAEVIYGNQAGEGEFHCTPFTPDFMNYCIVAAGFKEGTMNIQFRGSAIDKGFLRNDTLIAECKK